VLLTCVVATKIGSYPELDPWNVNHILGFITPSFLPIFVMIMAALAIFQTWIWIGVVTGKFLIDLSVTNIWTQNYVVWEHTDLWLAVCFVALL